MSRIETIKPLLRSVSFIRDIVALLFYSPHSLSYRATVRSFPLFICCDKLNVCLYPFHPCAALSGDIPSYADYPRISRVRGVNEPCAILSHARNREVFAPVPVFHRKPSPLSPSSEYNPPPLSVPPDRGEFLLHSEKLG